MAASKSFSNIISYELTRKIAEGGMDVFHEERQRGPGHLEKRVAINLIRDDDPAVDAIRRDSDLIAATLLQRAVRPKHGEHHQSANEMMANPEFCPNGEGDGPTSGKLGLYLGSGMAARHAPSKTATAPELVGLHQGARYS